MDSRSKEQFRSEMELKFWCEIYKGSCGGDSQFSEENPAAEAGDRAVAALRERLKYLIENQPPPEQNEDGGEKKKTCIDLSQDARGDDDLGNDGPGNYMNSPK